MSATDLCLWSQKLETAVAEENCHGNIIENEKKKNYIYIYMSMEIAFSTEIFFSKMLYFSRARRVF